MSGSDKQFYLVVQLVKSQIYIEKLLKKVSLKEAEPNLGLLEEKYPWIKAPLGNTGGASGQTLRPRPAKPKYVVVNSFDTQGLGISKTNMAQSQAKVLPTKVQTSVAQKQPQQAVQKLSQPQAAEEPQTNKFNPKNQTDDPNDDRTACPFCGRKFTADRIEKHQTICAENPAKKKKRQAMTFKPTMQ